MGANVDYVPRPEGGGQLQLKQQKNGQTEKQARASGTELRRVDIDMPSTAPQIFRNFMNMHAGGTAAA